MIDELLGYYNSELEYLREMGAEFAGKYPRLASRLLLEADKCEDPHVERLLEGVAFLTARVRKKIDDEFPEITDGLIGLLQPHYQRPLPSMTVVQFVPGRDAARAAEPTRIEQGTRLDSRPAAGGPCRFRTTSPVALWPVDVAAVRLDLDRVNVEGKPPDAVALLQLTLRPAEGLSFGQLGAMDRLRFYLDGTGTTPYVLHELLLNDARGVMARGRTADGRVELISLPPDCLRPVGFEPDEAMFPQPGHAFPGYRLLQEFFAFPQKFLFVDMTGLSRLSTRGFVGDVDLLVFLGRSPRSDLMVQPETFRLGCAPAVNLFPLITEPIALSQVQHEYRVVPDVARQGTTEVYSVDGVSGSDGYLGKAVEYRPFYSVQHGADGRPSAYWHAARRPSPRKDDPGTEVYLSFTDPEFNPRVPASEVITVRATCTNRDLPAKLPFGGEAGDFTAEAGVSLSRVRCLVKPTRSLRPPSGRGAQWRLISMLSLNHLSISDDGDGRGLDALREILRLHDFADSPATRQMIGGIVGLSCRRVAGRTGRAFGPAACLGQEVTVEFDEAEFAGSSAFLLASVLDRFLGLYASINSFSQLVARTRQREGILRKWPPRAGDRPLL
ncbi:type VI secretion system baseplate subunit TssF [Isosphaeraceae bacterium EP7]